MFKIQTMSWNVVELKKYNYLYIYIYYYFINFYGMKKKCYKNMFRFKNMI